MSTSASSLQHPNNKAGLARTTLLVVLGPEAVFFGTLLMVYLFLRTDQGFKPFSGQSLAYLVVPAINTAILLVSAGVARWSHVSITRGDQTALKASLQGVIVLGLVFIAGQVFEFSRSGMQPGDPSYGGIFFTLIGFHALHVLAGMVILIINLWRTQQGDFSAASHTPIQIGAWFWYFVTAVWVALFVALYLA